ncbi:MAG: hypothetical protein IJJ69_08070 [Oscillospiraceae bacterium]|nr:hypothetical protein [Oscillospiraceae bacterium]
MKRKLFLIAVFCLSALMITGCSDRGDGTPSETSIVQTEKTDTTQEEAVPFNETVGVWSYGDELVFHSSNGKRYFLTEDNAGSVQSTDGKNYSIQECDHRLYQIMNLDNGKMTVSEGRYFESALNSKDYPDGYKKLVVTYEKSDLFAVDALEKAVGGEIISDETSADTQTETFSETETSATETESFAPETESVAETETSVTETEASSDDNADTENAEYASIYKKIEDFLETDNYKQKDPGNRSLEIFNYLHNLADSNIEESSITNDVAKNEVSFKCYEKYTIIINNTDGTITVNTES